MLSKRKWHLTEVDQQYIRFRQSAQTVGRCLSFGSEHTGPINGPGCIEGWQKVQAREQSILCQLLFTSLRHSGHEDKYTSTNNWNSADGVFAPDRDFASGCLRTDIALLSLPLNPVSLSAPISQARVCFAILLVFVSARMKISTWKTWNTATAAAAAVKVCRFCVHVSTVSKPNEYREHWRKGNPHRAANTYTVLPANSAWPCGIVAN